MLFSPYVLKLLNRISRSYEVCVCVCVRVRVRVRARAYVRACVRDLLFCLFLLCSVIWGHLVILTCMFLLVICVM